MRLTTSLLTFERTGSSRRDSAPREHSKQAWQCWRRPYALMWNCPWPGISLRLQSIKPSIKQYQAIYITSGADESSLGFSGLFRLVSAPRFFKTVEHWRAIQGERTVEKTRPHDHVYVPVENRAESWYFMLRTSNAFSPRAPQPVRHSRLSWCDVPLWSWAFYKF